MRKYKRVIIVGQAASGKDYLAEKFVERGFRKGISITTRPMREGEIDGFTYHYVSNPTFMMALSNNELYEHVRFNGWMYGILKADWDIADLFIMTPSGVKSIKKEDRRKCIVVYIEIDEQIRRGRLDARFDSDKTDRRILADKKDFKGFIDYDYRIKNPSFDATDWINILSENEIE